MNVHQRIIMRQKNQRLKIVILYKIFRIYRLLKLLKLSSIDQLVRTKKDFQQIVVTFDVPNRMTETSFLAFDGRVLPNDKRILRCIYNPEAIDFFQT